MNNPARFRHRIEIHGEVEYKNEVNAKSKRFEKIKTIWAAVIPQTGSLQRQQADTILTNITHKVIVRYSAGKDITKEMKIHFDGREFDIKYTSNPYFRNETFEIFVQEVLR